MSKGILLEQSQWADFRGVAGSGQAQACWPGGEM